MSINWQYLRPLEGSQRLAFEALCCQLAEYEPASQDSTFVRKAAPDAGVECYWKFSDGSERGWQAKFFTEAPGETQWSQLNDSVRTALNKHPQLTSLTICLPIDRADPRIEQQKWFMDRWDDHVARWQRWAAQEGRSVEFGYWGEHEIWERLGREEHRGRYLFWFSRELFSQQWFEDRIEEAVVNVGPRYSPELNVDLPIGRLFDGLGRTSAFYNRLKSLHGKVRKAHRSVRPRDSAEYIQAEIDSLQQIMAQLLPVLASISDLPTDTIALDSISDLVVRARHQTWKCISLLEDEAKRRADSDKEGQTHKDRTVSGLQNFDYQKHHLYELAGGLTELGEFVRGNEARLANLPALLLVGAAGTGKTHILCDVALRRTREGSPTILLIGGQFSDHEPWSQIVGLLGLSCSRDDLLDALEVAAQVRGKKALILVDALNEGEGKRIWNRHLAGILTTLSRHPWLAIALSVRTSYESAVIPEHLVPGTLIREVHYGFASHEYQATRTFFDYFGIMRPSIPLLVPEFQNPLFLKLFCQGLTNRGMTRVPPGFRGVTAIFGFFIESVNEKLSRPDHLDFDPHSSLVQKAVEKLAEKMSDTGHTWLPREDAQASVDAFLPQRGYEESLFRHLISEGLLSEDMMWIDGNECDVIHFSYERLADHRIAEHLLNRYLDNTNPAQSFAEESYLGPLLEDERSCRLHRGLIEALSIQLPERIGHELTDLAPRVADFESIREAFVESLIWRDAATITDVTLSYINDHIVSHEDAHDRFLDAILTIASNPEHPYNADFLHHHLMSFALAERDAWWSIFLHKQYGEQGAVNRLIAWAWSSEDKSHIDSESIRLCGIALAWFLTASNRFVRDRATKALVRLFTGWISTLRQLIAGFLNVNDPYVLERLFAVAYGCAMRSTDNSTIGELAQEVYEWVFKEGHPPADILLRDYARGVIELALHRGIEIDVDIALVRPPYQSEWPSEIPSKDSLKEYGEFKEDMPDEELAQLSIYASVVQDLGDFAHYVIGATYTDFEWSMRRLGEPRQPSVKEMCQSFVQSLTDRQKKAWDRYHNIRQGVDAYRSLDRTKRLEICDCELTEEELDSAVLRSEETLRKTLGKRKLQIYEKTIAAYLSSPPTQEEDCFDLSIAQRWIFQRVFELGWTVERFGRFDRYLDRYHNPERSAHKAERIGKKYQWIAYHEFLARVSDNFAFRGGLRSEQSEKYNGPWQMSGVRDIDPSWLPNRTGDGANEAADDQPWWMPRPYDAWDAEPDDETWLQNSEDLPAAERFIDISNPQDGSRWFTLEAQYTWEQPISPAEEHYELPRRRIWYQLRSYFVRKSDMDASLQWAEATDLKNERLPGSSTQFGIFLGEFFWSPAFRHFNVPYYDHEGWTQGIRNRIPVRVLVSSDQYGQEGNDYDCSLNHNTHLYLPCQWLADSMSLRWNGVEGSFFDETGALIAFDPSVRLSGPGALLLAKDALLNFLNANDYDILWTVTGEKQCIGGSLSPRAWKGRLDCAGAYRLVNGRLEGELKTRFLSRD